jgi:hypothetical protein
MSASCVALLLCAAAGTLAGESEYAEPEAVHNAVQDVLNAPEFRNLPRLNLGPGGTNVEPLKSQRDAGDTVVRPTPTGGLGILSDLVAMLFGGAISLSVVLLLAAVLGAIVALIVLGVKRWERTVELLVTPHGDSSVDDEPEPAITPGERSADAWLGAARAAAASGRFDEALALLMLGAMGHVERVGLIRPRRGLTYRDYLRAVPHTSPWHGVLDRLIRVYAPVGFGRRAATAEAFASVVSPYEAALRVEPPPARSSGMSPS